MGMATYNGQKYGDGSWTEDAHWGSYKFFFTENNVVHNLVKTSGNMDAKRGARYVVRYSKIYDCSFIQTHGTEGDRDRDAGRLNSTIISVTEAMRSWSSRRNKKR